MRIKKIIRLLAVIAMVGIASVVPFPINYRRKDEFPKVKIEQLDEEEESNEEDTVKY
ncbi:hypothetical protein [Poritiphilus flavus]|uniref:Uncharacterized protein n=1 Tax=Poritiphilus flavus TaxID=2697053 RepID=A0A6L9EE42_9FLAO|nr:hypothetical protein [Poritiphilus flavus]NAS12977.1 hypothetical protein [Poritiphilus flavus]